MPDSTESHPRESEVFPEAAEIEDPVARAAFLDQACGDDAHLRARVEKLLGLKERPELMEPES